MKNKDRLVFYSMFNNVTRSRCLGRYRENLPGSHVGIAGRTQYAALTLFLVATALQTNVPVLTPRRSPRILNLVVVNAVLGRAVPHR